MEFNFWLMRHGDKRLDVLNDEAGLTEIGREQVRTSTEKYLKNVYPDRLYTSDIPRTKESMVVVNSVFARKNELCQPEVLPVLCYTKCPYEKNNDIYMAAIEVLMKRDGYSQETVLLWKQVAPELVNWYANGLSDAFFTIMRELAVAEEKEHYNTIMTGHSRLIEMPALELPITRPADIVRYQFKFPANEPNVCFSSAEILRSGF